MHVDQRGVGLAFLESVHNLGFPAVGQFLEGAHVNIAVVEKRFQPGHVFDEKAPIVWAEPRCSMTLSRRPSLIAICTAIAPETVLTLRRNGLTTPYPTGPLVCQHTPNMTE